MLARLAAACAASVRVGRGGCARSRSGQLRVGGIESCDRLVELLRRRGSSFVSVAHAVVRGACQHDGRLGRADVGLSGQCGFRCGRRAARRRAPGSRPKLARVECDQRCAAANPIAGAHVDVEDGRHHPAARWRRSTARARTPPASNVAAQIRDLRAGHRDRRPAARRPRLAEQAAAQPAVSAASRRSRMTTRSASHQPHKSGMAAERPLQRGDTDQARRPARTRAGFRRRARHVEARSTSVTPRDAGVEPIADDSLAFARLVHRGASRGQSRARRLQPAQRGDDLDLDRRARVLGFRGARARSASVAAFDSAPARRRRARGVQRTSPPTSHADARSANRVPLTSIAGLRARLVAAARLAHDALGVRAVCSAAAARRSSGLCASASANSASRFDAGVRQQFRRPLIRLDDVIRGRWARPSAGSVRRAPRPRRRRPRSPAAAGPRHARRGRAHPRPWPCRRRGGAQRAPDPPARRRLPRRRRGGRHSAARMRPKAWVAAKATPADVFVDEERRILLAKRGTIDCRPLSSAVEEQLFDAERRAKEADGVRMVERVDRRNSRRENCRADRSDPKTKTG